MIWIIIGLSTALIGVTAIYFIWLRKYIRLNRKFKAIEQIKIPDMQPKIYKKEFNIDTIYVDAKLSQVFCESYPEYENMISNEILRQLTEGLKDYVVIHEIPDIQLTDLAPVRVFRGELRVIRPEGNDDKQREIN